MEMGLVKLQPNRFIYVSFDNETGKLVSGNDFYDAISGYILGFGSHEFEFKGRQHRKFDIYVGANGSIYQVQFGFYSWVTFRLMNILLNFRDFDHPASIFTGKDTEGNFKVFVQENGVALKWKYKMEQLKISGSTEDKEKRRNQIIDKWFEILITKKPFESKPEKEDVIEEDLPY